MMPSKINLTSSFPSLPLPLLLLPLPAPPLFLLPLPAPPPPPPSPPCPSPSSPPSQIRDEVGFGTAVVVEIRGRSNQFDPVFDANGDQVEGIGFSVTFTEGTDQEVAIISTRAFFSDSDTVFSIERVSVTLLNPQLPTEEFLSLIQNPPSTLEVTGVGTTTIVITAPDPEIASENDFFTVLVSIRYNNSANEPVAVPRMIEFVVFDGLRENFPRAQTVINVETFNDAPSVDVGGDGFVQYMEASPELLIAEDLTIIDEDSVTLVEASVSLAEVFDVGSESISLNTALLPVGVTCFPTACSGTDLMLSGVGSIADYQEVLRSLTYINVLQPEELPNLRDRVILIQVSDGQSFSDTETSILLDFLPATPRVIIQLDVPNQNYTTSFTEGQLNPIPVVGLVRVIDTSLDTLESVVISIRDNLPGGIREEAEEITLSDFGGFPFAIEINTVLKRITFSQEASIDDYVAAINRIRYFNGQDEPIPLNRFVDFDVIPGGGAPNDTAHANITIININDFDPVCDPQFQFALVPEDTTPGSPIHQLEATDNDIGRDGDITYAITDGDVSLFSVTTSGEIRLAGEVDFEGLQSHLLEVQACDLGVPQRCCSFNLQINITDANDNPPVFENSTYRFTVSENVVTFISDFVIRDADSEVNAQLSSLQILSSNPMVGCVGLFAVFLGPPSLSTVSPGLDFEATPTCTLVLEAADAGIPTQNGTTTVIVSIRNEDDFPPEFLLPAFKFTVAEGNSFPVVIGPGQLSATDRDSPSFSFSLDGTAMFEVDGENGELTILFSTDYDIATQHNFTAVATDPAGNFATALVSVCVLPINNDAPVLDLNITDPLSNNVLSPVVFTEEAGVPVLIPTDPFISDPDAVQLEITRIRIRVANSGNLAAEVLSVLVTPSTPTFLTVSDTGSEIILQSQDPTNLDDVYALLQSVLYLNTEDEISPCRSDLYLCLFGDASRTILFSVLDGVQFSAESEAYITFEAVNDAPEIDLDTRTIGSGFTTNFEEGGPPVNITRAADLSITDDDDTRLVSLTCTLSNPLDGASESLILGGPIPSGLTLDSSLPGHTVAITGVADVSLYGLAVSLIQYTSVTNNPDTTPREVECSVSDGDLTSNVAVATILFETVNQPPSLDLDTSTSEFNFTTLYVEEGGPVPLASSADIFDDDNARMRSLVVILSGATDLRESLALDASLLTSAFTLFNYSFPELRLEGVADIAVYSAIINSITYDNAMLEIPDRGDRMVQFVVTDEGGAESLPVYSIIQIQAVDDNIPIFVPSSVYNFTVEENAPRLALVGTVEIQDADLPPVGDGLDLDFRILSAEPAFGTSDFEIRNSVSSPLMRELRVIGEIDFDLRATTYSLTIQVSSGSFVVNATVFVSVINLPDIDPVFSFCPLVFMVFENERIGENLSPPRVTAVDPDGLDAILYTLSGNIIAGVELIDIDSETGELVVQNNIDRENRFVGPDFDVTITASDSVASISKNVTVVILGVNEDPPMFSQVNYQAEIEENALPSGLPLVTVMATDADEAPDSIIPGFVSNITYAILPGPGAGSFSIDPFTGEVTQIEVIDFEDFSSIVLRVEANDNDFSSEPMSAVVDVVVAIRNVNDEAPFFIDLLDFIQVSELTEETDVFHTILFNDPDPNSNLQLRFADTPPTMFLLNAANGQLSVLSPLDADIGPTQFNFTIVLTDLNTDANFTERSSISADITIAVVDANDIAPTFAEPLFEGDIIENSILGTSILQVAATDGDLGRDPFGNPNGNSEVRYSLGGDAPAGLFVINETTGVITKGAVLDREVQSVYLFSVIARDSPLSGSENDVAAFVRIEVLDVNEHPPIPDPSNYFLFIAEDTMVPAPLQTFVRVQWTTDSKCLSSGRGAEGESLAVERGGGASSLQSW